MTISSTVRKAGPFPGTGLVTTYPFAFKVFQASEVLVQQIDTVGNITTLALTSAYTVALNSDQNGNPGGNVVLNSALAAGYTLVIGSQVQQLQSTLITNNGGFYPAVITDALDRLTILVQQQQQTLNSSLQLPFAVTGVSTTLPAPSSLKIIGWNATANALQNIDPASLGTTIQATTWKTDVFTGTGAQTAFTLSNNPGSTFAVICAIGGVAQIPGVDFSVTGTTLTFTSAPPNGAKVMLQYGQAVGSGSITSSSITDATAFGKSVLTSANPTAAGLQAAGSYAASGANNDINSLNALTTVPTVVATAIAAAGGGAGPLGFTQLF